LWGTGHQFHDISDIRPFAYSSVDTDFDYSTPIVPDRGAINAPVIDVDRKSGRIYVAFVERDDTTTNVRVVSSTDNGATWGSPVTGLPVTVDDTSGSTDILPWLAVDQTTGSVNVMYYTDAGTDIDPATGTHPLSKPRLATSIDQGATFIHADVSSATSDERGASALDYGEYLGLAVHDGTAQALWARGVSGLNDSYSTSVSFQSGTSGNVLTINGDDSGSPTADTILVRRNATNSAFIEVIVNGVQQFCGLYGTVNSIVINGFGGNDTIAIDSGVSLPGVINGGDGNDSITGGTGNDTIDGGAGSDTITGGASGNDSLLGGDGNDTIDGGSGLGYNNNNTINGGAGNDSLVGGNGDDVIAGGSGADTMKGLAGNDTLDYSASAIAISVNLFNNAPQGPEGDAVTGFENVDGSAFNDTITGDDSGNALNGNGGDDVITGGMTSNNGGDTIDGGSGNDTISVATGTNGGSSLLGSDGNDSITGGTGDDTIDGGAGNDSLYGGAGNDILTGGTGQDYLSGGDGDDAFATGDSEIDTIYGGNGHDSILDKDSNDVLFDNVPD
jgi:Ca2+-binding RTX toxin-like protein